MEKNNYSAYNLAAITGFAVALIGVFLPLFKVQDIGVSAFRLVVEVLKAMASGLLPEEGRGILLLVTLVIIIFYLLILFAILGQIIWKNQKKGEVLGIVVGALNTLAAVGLLVIFLYAASTVSSWGSYLLTDDQSDMIWKEVMGLLGIGFWMFLLGNLTGFILSIVMLVQDKKVSAVLGYLMGLSGEYHGVSIPMRTGEVITLGRDPQICNLVLKGNKVSRRHCTIRYEAVPRQYFLKDSSKNGTYMGSGERMPEGTEIPLQQGAVFYLGDRDNSFRVG